MARNVETDLALPAAGGYLQGDQRRDQDSHHITVPGSSFVQAAAANFHGPTHYSSRGSSVHEYKNNKQQVCVKLTPPELVVSSPASLISSGASTDPCSLDRVKDAGQYTEGPGVAAKVIEHAIII